MLWGHDVVPALATASEYIYRSWQQQALQQSHADHLKREDLAVTVMDIPVNTRALCDAGHV